jgi:hypothetical protein
MNGNVRYLLFFLASCAAGLASPALAVTQTASVNAQVVKPLTLTSLSNLDLGTIILGSGTWSGATVGISQAGVLSCSTKVTCTGATQAAQFNVTGTNKMVVLISAPDLTLVNQNDASKTLTLTLDKPAQVTLPNAGQQGVNFNVGGSVTVDSTTVGGTYRGTIEVTVNYQ